MNTWQLKEKLKRKLKRPIHIEELNEIGERKGKKILKRSRSSGGTSYSWEESEIPEIISILESN